MSSASDTLIGNFESYLKDDIPKDFCDLVGEVYFVLNKGALLLTCKFCDENFLTASKFLNHLHDFHLFIRPPIDNKIVLNNKIDTECVDEPTHMDLEDENLELNKSIEINEDLNRIIPHSKNNSHHNCYFLASQTFQEQPNDPNLINPDSSSFVDCLRDEEPKDFLTSSENFNEYQPNSELPSTLITNFEEQNIVFNGNIIHHELPVYNHVFQNNDKIGISSTTSVSESVGVQQYDTLSHEISKQFMLPAVEAEQIQEFEHTIPVSNDNILYKNISTSDLYIRYNEVDGTYDLINCSAELIQTPGSVLSVINHELNENCTQSMNSDYNLVEKEVDNTTHNIFVNSNIDEASFIEKSQDIDMNSIESENQNIYHTFDDFRDAEYVECGQEMNINKCSSQPLDDNNSAKASNTVTSDIKLQLDNNTVKTYNTVVSDIELLLDSTTPKPSNPVAPDINWQLGKKEGYFESFQKFLKCDKRIAVENQQVRKKKVKNSKQGCNNKARTDACPRKNIQKKLRCGICGRDFIIKANLAKHMKIAHGKSPETKFKKVDEIYKKPTINGCSNTYFNTNGTKHKKNHNNYKEDLVNKPSENNVQKNNFEIESISEYSNHSPDTTEANSPSKYLNTSNNFSLNNSYYDMQANEVVTEVIIDNNEINLDYSDFIIPLESEEPSNINLNVT